jgi:uncharacterized protein YbaA (DUF1428 family)
MARYVDGFVLPIPKKNIAAYKKQAKMAGKVWMKYGALEYIECQGDDVPEGKLTSFPMSVKLKKDEVAFFSWIVYKSKAHRTAVLKKVMSDPKIQKMMEKMPFDTKRMIYGGFKQVITL